MKHYSKSEFLGKITEIKERRAGTKDGKEWELVRFTVLTKNIYKNCELWHNTEEFVNSYAVGSELVITAYENRDKGNDGNYYTKYNVITFGTAEEQPKEPTRTSNEPKEEKPYPPVQPQFGITDDDLPF
jgi:single-stranded DNA-binding protein